MVLLREITDATIHETAVCSVLKRIVDESQYSLVRRIQECREENREQHQLDIPATDFGNGSEPFTTALNANSFLIGLPVATESDSPAFAVGTISGVSQEIVLRLVETAWENVRLEQQTTAQLNQIDQYADQVLNDFSEIAWMQKLVSRLGLCSLANPLLESSVQLLEPLRELVQAEVLTFIPAAPGKPHQVPVSLDNSETHAWLAKDDGLKPAALRLLQKYSAAAQAGPIVRNRYVIWDDACEFVEVTGFMLVKVESDDHLAGWIMALNRIASDPHQTFGGNGLHTESEFSTSEAGPLLAAASILATHNQNLKLMQSNVNLSIGVIRALANAVDAKDEYTRGHSNRVARMAQQMGVGLNYTKKRCQQLLMTGLLHDVGKIGVPDHILKKSSRLTDEEFELIKLHPVHGRNIIAPVAELEFAVPGVLHHHESWDGSGYPEGLAGGDIPEAARILAIVDTYDAMTSERPYQKGIPFEVAEERIRQGAGQQWDPELVQLFLNDHTTFRKLCEEGRPKADSRGKSDEEESLAAAMFNGSVFLRGSASGVGSVDRKKSVLTTKSPWPQHQQRDPGAS